MEGIPEPGKTTEGGEAGVAKIARAQSRAGPSRAVLVAETISARDPEAAAAREKIRRACERISKVVRGAPDEEFRPRPATRGEPRIRLPAVYLHHHAGF